MFTGPTGRSGALITAVAVLTGAAIVRGGAAIADPSQDDRFLALLDQQGIPALRGVPSLIETGHDVCRTLDAGMPAAGLVDAMVNNAVGIDPGERDFDLGRLARTEARFITAAVGAYCPYDRGKIASLRTNPSGWEESAQRVTRPAVDLRSDLRELPVAVPSGEIDDPNPPQLPVPPPQAAQIQTPRQPIAAPSAPKHPPPPPQTAKSPPQQPPSPPQQMEPAGGPQPGGAGGSGGGGSAGGGNGGGSPGGNGGGVPADPSPGFVRLAP
ncbi:hypothetical protein AWB92_04695 [Mycobacterium sp. IEC1808]|uniref:DUF732 domain-containing protein n=1 Tax=Mycobacterium sp. IEC1808 TaxID=1743230 RepID=UPI000A156DBE|nr:DUF732 domain-containing protein [Mycobacterium sp. IEC1808]ORW97159.1 hypothetical protein AWB92_04695 [Mycobacterium sp. IEC1808]